MAGAQGFEPHLPDSESGVLPLNYAPTARQKYAMWGHFRQLSGRFRALGRAFTTVWTSTLYMNIQVLKTPCALWTNASS